MSDSDGNRTELKKPSDSAMCPLASSSRNGWTPQPRGAHLAGAFGRCSSRGDFGYRRLPRPGLAHPGPRVMTNRCGHRGPTGGISEGPRRPAKAAAGPTACPLSRLFPALPRAAVGPEGSLHKHPVLQTPAQRLLPAEPSSGRVVPGLVQKGGRISSPRAVVTNDHKLGGLTRDAFIPSQSGAWNSKIEALAGQVPPGGSEGESVPRLSPGFWCLLAVLSAGVPTPWAMDQYRPAAR